MRVLLVQPSCIVTERSHNKLHPYLPIGLGYLAASLRVAGHQVEILDTLTEGWENRGRIEGNLIEIGLKEEDVAAAIRRFRPQVVGFSVPFITQMVRLRSLSRWVKAIHPEIFVICGGSHATADPYEILEIPEVDLVVLGEGEAVLPNLLNRIEHSGQIERLEGIAYRNRTGGIVVSPLKNTVEKLDSLPAPAYDLLPLKKYFKIMGKRCIPLFTSRGCGQSCVFCNTNKIFGGKTRYESPAIIVEHMRFLLEYYGVREFYFDDDRLFSNKEHLHDFLTKLQHANLKLQWTGRGGVDPNFIDEHVLAQVKKTGGKRLHFAPGSGSRRVLKKFLQLPLDLYSLEKAVARTIEAGIGVTCHFIIGTPGETLEEVFDTLNFAWKLRSMGVDEFHFSIATPFPGSKMRSIAQEMECLQIHPDTALTTYEATLSSSEISADEIRQIRDTAEREFTTRGLIVNLSRKVVPWYKENMKLEDRFFPSVAPQPANRRRPGSIALQPELVEEAV